MAAPFQIAANGDFFCILMFFQQLINGLTTAVFMPSSPWVSEPGMAFGGLGHRRQAFCSGDGPKAPRQGQGKAVIPICVQKAIFGSRRF